MLLETEPNDVLSIKLQRGYSNSEETDNNVIEVEVTLETRNYKKHTDKTRTKGTLFVKSIVLILLNFFIFF